MYSFIKSTIPQAIMIEKKKLKSAPPEEDSTQIVVK